jgi:two-component system, NarL family, invasion response regulator UvrY
MTTDTVRLLIADDQPAVRRSICRMLNQAEGIVVAGEASDGDEVFDRLREGTYDAVLLDLAMPKRHGLDVLRELKLLQPSLPVLILSIYPPDQYKLKSMQLGAAAYITKDEAPEILVREIRKAVEAL